MRSGIVRMVMAALAALLISFIDAGSARGQVVVAAEQDLQFGTLTPGFPVSVDPTDFTRSAQLRVVGRGRYQVTFQLPAHLSGPGGAQIPLAFGAVDGRVDIRGRVMTFDPRSPFEFRINPVDQDAQINLGGRASPAPGQPSGPYSATITMMIVQTGS